MNQINRLLGIMQRLRDPENGCPWDKEQTFATIAPYTLEETYEVLDAIAPDAQPHVCTTAPVPRICPAASALRIKVVET